MVIVVSALVVAAVLVVPGCCFVLIRRVVRGSRHTQFSPTGHRTSYGWLPGIGPVGSLGELSPDADLAATGSDPAELYGDGTTA
jgi:hypothetical protein